MKISVAWLREYVEWSGSLGEWINQLTIAGLEVISCRLYGQKPASDLKVKLEEPGPVWDREKVVIAQVKSVSKHPNADKLKLVQLEYGEGTTKQVKQVVTGAPNISVGDTGQKVVLGLSGCHYFDGHVSPKVIKELKPSVLRGVDSDAMVMSNFELGISDEHEGIIILEDEAPVGKPLVDYFGDAVLEIDILPNMARCFAMRGLAREAAAIFGVKPNLPIPNPKFSRESITDQVKIEIENPQQCGRYTAMLIRNVKIGPSPAWLQRRLLYSGIRSINNVVDITNYVLLEYGQPLHAFDYDILKKRANGKFPTIQIRQAKTGEKLQSIDREKGELSLHPEMIVIADEKGPIALAGVKGGSETEVTAQTTNILLESANFHPVAIRKTARELDLFTDASTRFSRGIHTEIVAQAALRAAELLQQYAHGEVVDGIADCYPLPAENRKILLRSSEIKRILGVDIPHREVERILATLDFQITKVTDGEWQVTAPTHRIDIQTGCADLIEEIARIYGYDRFPETMLSEPIPEQHPDPALSKENLIRDTLVSLGLQEIISYSLTSLTDELALDPSKLEAYHVPVEGKSLDDHQMAMLHNSDHVRLLNPISPERAILRKSLIPHLLGIAQRNLQKSAEWIGEVKIFEIGAVYLPQQEQKLPLEPRYLSILCLGHRHPIHWDSLHKKEPERFDFFDMKGIIEQVFQKFPNNKLSWVNCQTIAYLHPARAAELYLGNEKIGVVGELHPLTAQHYHLQNQHALVAEIDLDIVFNGLQEKWAVQSISIHPPAIRDIAFVVEETISNQQAVQEIQIAGGDLLKKIELFDLYRGEPIPSGKKNLAYTLTYQSALATLSDKDVDKIHKRVIDALKQKLKAQIRGLD